MSWWNFVRAVFRKEHKLAPMTWVAAVFTVIYTISPIDFIPDMFPIVGQLDDLGLWGVLLLIAAREKSRYEVAVHGGEYVKATRVS